MFAEHHASDHDPDECSCEFDPFSTWPCAGCGDYHHGERYAMTLVYVQRATNDEAVRTGSTSDTTAPAADHSAAADDDTDGM
jgi:hypothetical protein